MTRRDDAWAAANARWDAREACSLDAAGDDAELARDLARVDTLLDALRARGAARRRRRGLAALGVAVALVLALRVSGAWSPGAVSLEAPRAAVVHAVDASAAHVAATRARTEPSAAAHAGGRILSSRLAVERTVHLPAGWVRAGAHRGAKP